MKKLLIMFFAALGVIFLIIMVAAVYFYITDPLELRPLLSTTPSLESAGSAAPAPTPTTDAHPVLSDTQEKALQTIGIDPATLPTEITPAQMECFEAALGSARVAEIQAGATPTPTEFFKARHCLQ